MTWENRLEFANHCRDIFWQLMKKEKNNIEAVEARYVLEMLDFGLLEPIAYVKKQGRGTYYLRLTYNSEHTLFSGVLEKYHKEANYFNFGW